MCASTLAAPFIIFLQFFLFLVDIWSKGHLCGKGLIYFLCAYANFFCHFCYESPAAASEISSCNVASEDFLPLFLKWSLCEW